MRRRPPVPRRAGAAASAAVALAALSGCGLIEEPTPFITAYSEGSADQAEATAYCFEESETLDLAADAAEALPEGCESFDRPPTVIEVTAGSTVGFSVATPIKEGGWTVNNDGEVRTEYTAVFPASGVEQPQPVLVTTLRDADPAEIRGIYLFCLVPRGTAEDEVTDDCAPTEQAELPPAPGLPGAGEPGAGEPDAGEPSSEG